MDGRLAQITVCNETGNTCGTEHSVYVNKALHVVVCVSIIEDMVIWQPYMCNLSTIFKPTQGLGYQLIVSIPCP